MITTILKFIAKHFLTIHKGTWIAKVKAALALSVSISPIAYIAEKITDWTFENEAYVVFVLGAIIVDHILGTLKHLFIEKDFTIKANLVGLAIKVGLVVAVGFLFEGVNFIVKEDSFVKSYAIVVLRMTVFLYPGGSAFWNSYIMTKGKFPPVGFINKIKRFNLNLDVREFKEVTHKK